MKRIPKPVQCLIAVSVLISACKPEPKTIAFGQEACSYCSMTIIDTQHAAQLVTDKGKVYSFDAIECMLQSEQLKDTANLAFVLCNDYADPGAMIDVNQATFLISERVPSPMGAYLSGFASMESAQKLDVEDSAEYLNWEALYSRYRTDQ